MSVTKGVESRTVILFILMIKPLMQAMVFPISSDPSSRLRPALVSLHPGASGNWGSSSTRSNSSGVKASKIVLLMAGLSTEKRSIWGYSACPFRIRALVRSISRVEAAVVVWGTMPNS